MSSLWLKLFDVHHTGLFCAFQVHFSTGPASPETHWKQTVFYLNPPIAVSAGMVVLATIHVNVVNLCSHIAVSVATVGCGADHGAVVNTLYLFLWVLVW